MRSTIFSISGSCPLPALGYSIYGGGATFRYTKHLSLSTSSLLDEELTIHSPVHGVHATIPFSAKHLS